MSWATIWRSKARCSNQEPSKNRSTLSGMYRAYVPLQNVDTFYQAFDIKKVTECTSRQKTELKSGSRINV
jgi:predicted metalloendopeptidase